MNVIEAYVKFNKRLVILISGLPGCGKTDLAHKISMMLGCGFVNANNYYKKNYNVTVTLPTGVSIVNYDSDDAVDWNSLNKDIDKPNTCTIVSGFAFPTDKITVPYDYHIHLVIKKMQCLEKRREFLEKHKNEYPDDYKLINTDSEKVKMNQYTYPYYLKTKENSNINKFINTVSLTDDEIMDKVFGSIVHFILERLHGPQYKELYKKELEQMKL